MYSKFSDASQRALGKSKAVIKRALKKGDTDSIQEINRLFEASSAKDAAMVFTSNVDPELAEEISRHIREDRVSKSMRDYSAVVYLNLTLVASSLLKWMKTNGYYGTTFKEALDALWEYESLMYRKVCITIHNDAFLKERSKIVLSRAQWMQAIRATLLQYNAEGNVLAKSPRRVVSPEFSLFYAQVLLYLYHEVRYDRMMARPWDDKRADNSEVYLARIEELTKQLDALREENDRLLRKERKDLDSVIAPLEREIADRDAKIEILREENELIRHVHEELRVQEDLPDELLELPERGVMFIGGASPLRKKIQARFPEWKVVSTTDIMKVTGSPSVVFLYTDYISHTMTAIVKKNLNTTALYCHGTNIERLEQSMRAAYTLDRRRCSEKA